MLESRIKPIVEPGAACNDTSVALAARFNGLDHLRALAILLVMLFHYDIYYGAPPWLEPLSQLAWIGVELFFVLSGFLIGTKLLGEQRRCKRVEIGRFYLNRLFRIVPAYLVVVALYFLIPDIREGRGLQALWRFLSFTQNLPIDLANNTFSHSWSLAVEEHFYLLLPWLVVLIAACRWPRYVAAIFICLLAFPVIMRALMWWAFIESASDARAMLSAWLVTIYYPSYTRLDGLTVGVALAAIAQYRPRWMGLANRHSGWLLIAGLLTLWLAGWLSAGFSILNGYRSMAPLVFSYLLIAFGFGLVVLNALCPGSLLYRMSSPVTYRIAQVSYSAYLVHKASNHLLQTQLSNAKAIAPGVMLMLSLVVALLLAWLLYQLVEKPFVRLGQRVIQRDRANLLN